MLSLYQTSTFRFVHFSGVRELEIFLLFSLLLQFGRLLLLFGSLLLTLDSLLLRAGCLLLRAGCLSSLFSCLLLLACSLLALTGIVCLFLLFGFITNIFEIEKDLLIPDGLIEEYDLCHLSGGVDRPEFLVQLIDLAAESSHLLPLLHQGRNSVSEYAFLLDDGFPQFLDFVLVLD